MSNVFVWVERLFVQKKCQLCLNPSIRCVFPQIVEIGTMSIYIMEVNKTLEPICGSDMHTCIQVGLVYLNKDNN